MKRILEMKEKRAGILANAQNIRTKANQENRDLTDEEFKLIEAAVSESEEIGKGIEALERQQLILGAFDKEVTQNAKQPERKIKEDNRPLSSDHHDRLNDDPKRGFATLGEFATKVHDANPLASGGRVAMDERLKIMGAATGMNQATGAEGGFLVPPEHSQQIYDKMMLQTGNLLAMTDQYQITGESLDFPAVQETSRATGSRWGGMRAYWLAEAAQLTASKPKLRNVKLEPQGLAALCYVTDKLLRNAPALEAFLTRGASEEINFVVSDAIFRGSGAGQPRGILNADCTIQVNKEASQAAATFNKQNANKMWSRMHPGSRARAVWLLNVDVEPQLDEFNTPIKNVAGTENVGGISTNIYNAEKNTIKGRPIIFTEYNETLGTVGDVMLVDMQAYATGLRSGLLQAMSMHLRFDYAETAFRFMFEVDGQPWLDSALTPYKGSNTLSPFVKLQTR